MHRSRTLWIGLVCLSCLWPASWAQGQRTVSELIESIKAQRERELEPRLASPRPLAAPPRTPPAPRSPPPAPPTVSAAPAARAVAAVHIAPVIAPEAPAAAPSGSSAAPQAAAPQPVAPIRPEPWPQVLSLTGINTHHRTELMIDRRVYPIDGEDLPQDVEGWLILNISERGVCLSRQGIRRCLPPPAAAHTTISAAQNPSPPQMRGSDHLGSGVRP